MRTSVFLTEEQLAGLQEMAAQLGYHPSRGAGAFKAGNVSAMLAKLADEYLADKSATLRRFALLLDIDDWSFPVGPRNIEPENEEPDGAT